MVAKVSLPGTRQQDQHQPRTVLAAKAVELVLLTYVDEAGQTETQLALVGDTKVHLLESFTFGISEHKQPQGIASGWLKDGVFKLLGRDVEAPAKGNGKAK